MSSPQPPVPEPGLPALAGDQSPPGDGPAAPPIHPACRRGAPMRPSGQRGTLPLLCAIGGALLSGLDAPLRATPFSAAAAPFPPALQAAAAARKSKAATPTPAAPAAPAPPPPVAAAAEPPPQGRRPGVPLPPPPLGAAALLGEEPLVLGGEWTPVAADAAAPLPLPQATPAPGGLTPAASGPGGDAAPGSAAPTLTGGPAAISPASAPATDAAAAGSPGSGSGTGPPRAPTGSDAAAGATEPSEPATADPSRRAAGSGSGTAGDAPAAHPATSLPPAPQRALVLERSRRRLRLLENGRELRAFPVAVGMEGWETPVGSFQVLNKVINPVWEHPQTGHHVPAGPSNPLGSRWIGFHRDCNGRRGWDGEQMLDVQGCVLAGFHGTPHRWTVGRAVSHGCVRLYEEHVREVFEFVSIGTPVTVLP